MHRWFRFCALIALTAFAQHPGTLLAEDEVPVSKHQIKPTAAQVVQHGFDEQNKRLDQVTALAQAQSKQLEEQGKQLQTLLEKAELQGRQIETLNTDLERLNTTLLARQSAEAPAPASAPRPSVQTSQPAPSAETPAAAPATPVVRADPATPDGVAPDGSPTHVVKRGETLTTIARSHGTSISELLRINKIEDERKLQVGQVLLLPKGAAAAPQPAAQGASPSSQSNPQNTP